jgi:hypothetical protein
MGESVLALDRHGQARAAWRFEPVVNATRTVDGTRGKSARAIAPRANKNRSKNRSA